MFATAEERYAVRVAVRLGRIHAWRNDAGESDHSFATSDRDCCNRWEARLHASATRNFAAQPWATAYDMSYRVRLALRRSEEHTSELQSPYDLVCRLLLEKKKSHNRQC